ncbi:MAG: hypothetical protein ACPGUC_02165 [Gammaproteobacteria bacterium]
MNAEFEISRSRGFVRIRAPRLIDLSIRGPLMDVARRVNEYNSAAWVMDLSQTTEVRDSGLTALKAVGDILWSETGASIEMHNAHPEVRARLESAGLA